MKARTDPKDILKRNAKQLDISQPHWGNQKVTAAQAIGAMKEYANITRPTVSEEVTDEEIEKQANVESGKSAYPDSHNAHRDYITFIAGANWMRDKHLTYQPVSEEDVKKAFQKYIKEWGLNPSVDKAFRHGFKAAIKELLNR